MQVVPGPITGIPEVTSCQSDHLPFKTTLCFLPFNLRVPLISLSVSLLALFQMLCQNQGILYLLLLSNISVTFSKNSRRFVVQDLLLRNPWFFIKLLSIRWLINWSLIIASKITFVFLSSKVLLLNVLLKFISRTDTADQSLIHFHRD